MGDANVHKRLLCVYQHAPTPDAPGIYRHRLWLSELVRRGWHVDLVSTPRNYMTGNLPAAYSGRVYTREPIEGITHHWVWASGGIHVSPARRALNYVTFAGAAAVRSATLPRPDVILVSSPPLTVGALGPVLARRFSRPWVLEVRDPWPQAGASVGWLSEDSHLYQLLDRLASRLASTAHGVIVPTPGLVETLHRQGAERVEVIPGAVIDTGVDDERRARVRAALGAADGTCLFVYLGSLGVANGLDLLLDAIGRLPADAQALFVLAGDGSARRHIEERVSRERLKRVRLFSAVPKHQCADFLYASDVCLHVLRPDPLFAYSMPTKLLDYFGAHRPFITTVPGVARRLALESGGSFSESAPDFADELLRWIHMPATERRDRGEQSFRYGSEKFSVTVTIDQLEAVLRAAAGHSPDDAPPVDGTRLRGLEAE